MSELPAGVSLGDGRDLPGVSQRGFWTPPLTSCMFGVLDWLLEWSGYITPLKRGATAYVAPNGNFVRRLHFASGAPLTRGTTTRESQRALRRLLPNAPILFGSLSDAELLEALDQGAKVRVIVPNCKKLPRRLRRWVGLSYDKGHAIGLEGRDGINVGWMDPLWRPARDIRTVDVPYSEIRNALARNGAGEVIVTVAYKGTAMTAERIAELEAEVAALREENGQLHAAVDTQAQQLAAVISARDEAIAANAGLNDRLARKDVAIDAARAI